MGRRSNSVEELLLTNSHHFAFDLYECDPEKSEDDLMNKKS